MSDLEPFLKILRSRLLVSEVVRHYISVSKKGREHMALCPFHKEKTPSFTINDAKGFFHCFGCGVHGDSIAFLMQHQNMGFLDAVEQLATQAGLDMPTFSKKNAPSQKVSEKLYDALEAACRWFQETLQLSTGESTRSYLQKRHVTPESIKTFRLGYAPEKGLLQHLQNQGFDLKILIATGLAICPETNRTPYSRFRDRLIFPITDRKNRVVAFGGRILGQANGPKYLNSPESEVFHKGQMLYGHPQASNHIKSTAPYIVVEGYLDVIALHQSGFQTAVAPLGTALTEEQIHLMWRRCPEPTLCFDGDAAGQRAAKRAAEHTLPHLKAGHSLRFCFLPAQEDPDSLLLRGRKAALHSLLEKPHPLMNVLWRSFLETCHLETPEGKADGRRRLFEMLNRIQSADVRQFYTQDLQDRLRKTLLPNRPKFLKTYETSLLSPTQGKKINKNDLSLKILLATLVNHPKLVEELSEQVLMLTIHDPDLDELRHQLIEIISRHPQMDRAFLLADLQSTKPSGLSKVLTENVLLHARFSNPEETYEKALEGWQDIWQRLCVDQNIKAEVQQTATEVKDALSPEAWEKLRHLKTTNVGNVNFSE